jgi:hypothetical protein
MSQTKDKVALIAGATLTRDGEFTLTIWLS